MNFFRRRLNGETIDVIEPPPEVPEMKRQMCKTNSPAKSDPKSKREDKRQRKDDSKILDALKKASGERKGVTDAKEELPKPSVTITIKKLITETKPPMKKTKPSTAQLKSVTKPIVKLEKRIREKTPT